MKKGQGARERGIASHASILSASWSLLVFLTMRKGIMVALVGASLHAYSQSIRIRRCVDSIRPAPSTKMLKMAEGY